MHQRFADGKAGVRRLLDSNTGYCWAIAALAFVHLAAFAYYFHATIIRHPFADMLILIGNFLDYRGNGGFWDYLWMPHTQHRPIWTRLITALDIRVFSGSSYPIMFFATASLMAVPILVVREIMRSGFKPTLTYSASMIVIMLTFTAVNAVDCSIPIEVIYPQTLIFSLISLALFVTADDGGLSHIQRGAALLFACVAGFASAVGLIVWPILVWQAWRSRTRIGWRWMPAVIVVAVGFTAFYLYGLPSLRAGLPEGRPAFYSVEHIVKIITYFVTYMGLPETRHPALLIVGRGMGLILTVIAVFCVVQREMLRPIGSRLERLATSLIMFSLATAVLASLGRVDQLQEVAVPVRYNIYLLPLRIGFVLLLLPWLECQWTNLHRRHVLQAAILAFAAAWTARQFPAGEAPVAEAREITAITQRFEEGIREPRMYSIIGADLAHAERILETMRQQLLYSEPRQENRRGGYRGAARELPLGRSSQSERPR